MAYHSVVAHEYGHGINEHRGRGGIANGGYSEGFGDAMSILLLRKSCVGEDFFSAGTCLRDAKDLIMWPPVPAMECTLRVAAMPASSGSSRSS